ncbi:NAD(+) synthase [Treponema sp.]|uniref:NAD(+) synthase n=1 Tax=Treponema sp. TaxID=166 RepID=UPI00298DED6B|nr:NAD(+) synthase [Treponema sp.]MCR5613707.1 NAD(+) synthase [Treponema sp.]
MSILKEEAIKWVKDYFAQNGNESTKAVIGISGGKDSSTVAALCCAALGKERVVGILMPNGIQKDINDSKKLCEFLGIENYTVNIEGAYKGLSDSVKTALASGSTADADGKVETPEQFNTNTPARLRMATLYGVAATLGNARISCNGNLSERLAGFFTLWGDGAGDFAPLAYLFVSEVVELGRQLGLPEELICKAPSDGMCGMTDEQKLGFTYAELEKVARKQEAQVEPQTVEKIKSRFDALAFKRRLLNIPSFIPSDKDPEDWR